MTKDAILLDAAVKMYLARRAEPLMNFNGVKEDVENDERFNEAEAIQLEYEALSQILETITTNQNQDT